MEDETKLKGKLTEEQEENLKKAIEDSEKWLKENQNNDKEDYEEELRELEKICNPIIQGANKKKTEDDDDADADL